MTCSHRPPCPPVDSPDRDAARVVASTPELGWSVLCNGAIVFHDPCDVRLERYPRTWPSPA